MYNLVTLIIVSLLIGCGPRISKPTTSTDNVAKCVQNNPTDSGIEFCTGKEY